VIGLQMTRYRHHAELAAAGFTPSSIPGNLPACVCHKLWSVPVWHVNCEANLSRALTRRCRKVIPNNIMRGCHDPAGGRGVYAEEEDRSVVIRAQPGARANQPPSGPPPGGLPTLVAFRGKARHIQIEGGRAFASTRSQPQDKDKGSAKPPDGPKLDEGCFDETQLAEGWIDPLYLIACGLSWRTQRDSGAGWELIGCLKLSGSAARIAAAFLVETKNVHLATPERAPVAGGFRKPSVRSEAATSVSGMRWRR
jgi:hypothetical protein